MYITCVIRGLQPLDVSCSKYFLENIEMVINNFSKLNKITLIGWDGNKPLDQTLPKHNIKYGFKVTKIWLLNMRVMNNKLLFNEMHIIINNRKTKHLAQKNLGLGIIKQISQ
jgi:hypothetical protein